MSTHSLLLSDRRRPRDRLVLLSRSPMVIKMADHKADTDVARIVWWGGSDYI